MLLARLENGQRFPVARNLPSPHKEKQIPLHNGRPQLEIGWDDEIAAARMEGTLHKKSWERPRPSLQAGAGSKAIWPAPLPSRQKSSDSPTIFHRSYPATL